MITDPRPIDYSEPFAIAGPVGNNAFAYERRGEAPRIWVPALIDGTWDDVAPGDRIAFADLDENGRLQEARGLAHLVGTRWRGVPAVVMDNHNHAFYFWQRALQQGVVKPGATLVHIDQHRDTRVPGQGYAGATLAEAFAYTNFHLNVGNYIVPARDCGLITGAQFVTGPSALGDTSLMAQRNKILNLDLDFFAPEMEVDIPAARRFIEAHLDSASLVTIATSPFFVDQSRALAVLRALI
ncbi:MAG: UPF0489 family protein [Vicinamibacterales bacterium]